MLALPFRRALARRCFALLAEQIVGYDDEASGLALPVLSRVCWARSGDLAPTMAILRRGLSGERANVARMALAALWQFCPGDLSAEEADVAPETWATLGAASRDVAALRSRWMN
jgi:hypothetical protein